MQIGSIFLVTLGLLALYGNVLASLGVVYDPNLRRTQKTGQLLFVWLSPVLGASLVLYLVYQHSLHAIPRSLVPWPISWIIFGKDPTPNPLRDDKGSD